MQRHAGAPELRVKAAPGTVDIVCGSDFARRFAPTSGAMDHPGLDCCAWQTPVPAITPLQQTPLPVFKPSSRGPAQREVASRPGTGVDAQGGSQTSRPNRLGSADQPPGLIRGRRGRAFLEIFHHLFAASPHSRNRRRHETAFPAKYLTRTWIRIYGVCKPNLPR